MMKMPSVGLGTWRASAKGEAGFAVKTALSLGVKHFDCAHVYSNEKEIGEVFAEHFKTHNRGDIWITSKAFNIHHSREHIEKAVRQTCANLQIAQLDLFMVHWPVAFKYVNEDTLYPKDESGAAVLDHSIPLETTWRGMEDIYELGLARFLGVCNYTVPQLDNLWSYAKIKPAFVQVESHPYFPNNDILNWCKAHGVQMVAYSPLGNPSFAPNLVPVLSDSILTEIAKELTESQSGVNVSSADVCLGWQLKRNVVVIPKSSKPERIESNSKNPPLVASLLNDDHMKRIDSLGEKRIRYVSPAWMKWD